MSDASPVLKWPATKIATWLNVPTTTVKEVAGKNNIDGKGGFDMYAMAPAMVEYYRDMSQKASRQKAMHQERREAADADSAEIDLEERKERLVIKADAKLVIADMLTQIRKAVEKASYLNASQRDRLGNDMRKIKILPLTDD